MVSDTSSHFRHRPRRDGNAVVGWFRGMWTRRWFRWLSYAAIAGLLGLALIWVIFARDLPSVDQLRDYEPPLPTMVRDGEGKPVHSYARERRVQLDYSEYPPLLVRPEENRSELQSLMRISYAVFCLKTKKKQTKSTHRIT